MHFKNTLLTILAILTASALGFKVEAFEGGNCTGFSQVVHVWDNTCRDTNTPMTWSIRVLGYGGHRQRAYFYKYSDTATCLPGSYPSGNKRWWVDGGGTQWKKRTCLNLGYGSRAFGSWHESGTNWEGGN